jgi:hypothetical protein
MALGPYATPGQVETALRADLPKSTIPITSQAYSISELYYGWKFAVDPTSILTSGGNQQTPPAPQAAPTPAPAPVSQPFGPIAGTYNGGEATLQINPSGGGIVTDTRTTPPTTTQFNLKTLSGGPSTYQAIGLITQNSDESSPATVGASMSFTEDTSGKFYLSFIDSDFTQGNSPSPTPAASAPASPPTTPQSSAPSPSGGETTFSKDLQTFDNDAATALRQATKDENDPAAALQSVVNSDGPTLTQDAQSTPWAQDVASAMGVFSSGDLNRSISAFHYLDGLCSNAGLPVQDNAAWYLSNVYMQMMG